MAPLRYVVTGCAAGLRLFIALFSSVMSVPLPAIELSSVSSKELYNNIALQSLLAKEHAVGVINKFVMDTFHDPNFPTYSKDLHIEWLPNLPQKPEVKAAVTDSYELLQPYALGLRRLVTDQILHNGTFLENFRQLERKLHQVLAELQMAMIEIKIEQRPSIHQGDVKSTYRDLEGKTARDLRDWIILRDYVATLEFVHTLFLKLNN